MPHGQWNQPVRGGLLSRTQCRHGVPTSAVSSTLNATPAPRQPLIPSSTYVTDRSPAMKMAPFAFGTTDWSAVEPTEHTGETGMAIWRTRYFGDEPNRIRVRMVEYTPGYLADHWCK